jgi:transposase
MVQALEGKFATQREPLPLKKDIFPPIPQDTAEAARSVLEKENFYLVTGDQLESLFLALALNRPPEWNEKSVQNLAMLYLVTVFQFIEGMPDDQAAEALQTRVDWKYALHLPLRCPALQAAVFCKFRQWLLVDQGGKQALDSLLLRLSEAARRGGKERFSLDSREILRGVCLLTRLSRVWASISHVLRVLTIHQPGWLRSGHVLHCYSHYASHDDLGIYQGGRTEMEAMAQTIGMNGLYLLKIIAETDAPGLAEQPEIAAMNAVWAEQYEWVEGRLQWRKDRCASCSFPLAGLHGVEAAYYSE